MRPVRSLPNLVGTDMATHTGERSTFLRDRKDNSERQKEILANGMFKHLYKNKFQRQFGTCLRCIKIKSRYPEIQNTRNSRRKAV